MGQGSGGGIGGFFQGIIALGVLGGAIFVMNFLFSGMGGYREPLDPPPTDNEIVEPEPVDPGPVAGSWSCYWDPTMNEDWHDDIACTNGVDYDRPILLADQSFVVAVATLSAATLALPAAADEPTIDDTWIVYEPMNVAGYAHEEAAAHGFELRYDDANVAWSVPIRNSPGDLTGASRIGDLPDDGVTPNSGGITPMGTVYGDCGYSWVDFKNGNASFNTGYGIYASKGDPVSHEWWVSIDTREGSAGGIGLYNLNGFPNTSNGLNTGRVITQPYTGDGKAKVTTGTVLTTAWIYCYSGNPSDSYYD